MTVILRRPSVRLHRAGNPAGCPFAPANLYSVDCELSSHLFHLSRHRPGKVCCLSAQLQWLVLKSVHVMYQTFDRIPNQMQEQYQDLGLGTVAPYGIARAPRRSCRYAYAVRLVCTLLHLARGRTGTRWAATLSASS